MSYLDALAVAQTPYPLPLAQLANAVVFLFAVLLVPTQFAGFEHGLWAGVLAFFLVLAFYGVLEAARELEDPVNAHTHPSTPTPTLAQSTPTPTLPNQLASSSAPSYIATSYGVWRYLYSVQLSVTPTDERTCVTDTCSISTEDPFPLCFSRTTSNNNNSPHSWAVFPGSSSPPPGVITQCAPPPPVSTGGFGLPPGACPRAHTRPLPF